MWHHDVRHVQGRPGKFRRFYLTFITQHFSAPEEGASS